MFELIILAFVFFIGYQIGQIVQAWQLRDLVISEAKRKGIIDDELNIIKDNTPSVHKLVVEKTNDVLYLYNREQNNEFICQADSIEELAKLAKQYKNIKYAAVLDDTHVYTFVDGKVEVKL